MNKKTNKKNKKHKKRYFKKGIIIYLSLLLIVTISVWILLWNKLSSYQAGIDNANNLQELEKIEKREPQLLFEAKINSMALEDWRLIYNASYPTDYNREDDITNLLNTAFATSEPDKLSYWKAPEYTESAPIFLVRNGDADVARFYLARNTDSWEISNIKLSIDPFMNNESYTITIPADCELTCNGKIVSSDLQTPADSFSLDGYEDSLTGNISYCSYTIDGLLNEPVVDVVYSDSNYSLTKDFEGNYYLAISDGSSYQTAAQSFVDSLLYYYASGKNNVSANMATAINKVASNSTASSIIKQSLDGVTWRYPSGITYNTRHSDAYVIAENCYFVDIFYKDSQADDSTVEEIYRVYFLDLGNGFKIYSFEMK